MDNQTIISSRILYHLARIIEILATTMKQQQSTLGTKMLAITPLIRLDRVCQTRDTLLAMLATGSVRILQSTRSICNTLVVTVFLEWDSLKLQWVVKHSVLRQVVMVTQILRAADIMSLQTMWAKEFQLVIPKESYKTCVKVAIILMLMARLEADRCRSELQVISQVSHRSHIEAQCLRMGSKLDRM